MQPSTCNNAPIVHVGREGVAKCRLNGSCGGGILYRANLVSGESCVRRLLWWGNFGVDGSGGRGPFVANPVGCRALLPGCKVRDGARTFCMALRQVRSAPADGPAAPFAPHRHPPDDVHASDGTIHGLTTTLTRSDGSVGAVRIIRRRRRIGPTAPAPPYEIDAAIRYDDFNAFQVVHFDRSGWGTVGIGCGPFSECICHPTNNARYF